MQDNEKQVSSTENNEYHHHHHHHSHHGSSHSHHSYSGRNSSGHKKKRHHHVSSSERERRGENIIYKNVRKDKMKMMFKRITFLFVVVLAIVFLIYAIYTADSPNSGFKFIKNDNNSAEDLNDIKIKLVQYEDYIAELENRIESLEIELSGYRSNEE